MCADPAVAMAGSCCVTRASGELAQCRYKSELMSYATSEARCHSEEWSPGGGEVCALIRPINDWRYDLDPNDGNDPLECGYHGRGSDTVVRMWSRQPCAVQIEVDRNGWVNYYDPAYTGKFSNRPSFGKGNGNLFRVAWEGAVEVLLLFGRQVGAEKSTVVRRVLFRGWGRPTRPGRAARRRAW